MSHEWEIVAGLEIHAQLQTKTKAFCRCPNLYGADPNTLVCPVCLGMPGALPVLNRETVSQAARLVIAVGGTIHLHSKFDRKNYFYADLPKGYQISQYDEPFSTGGAVRILAGGQEKTIRITRAHLEEDAGKSMHLDNGASVVDMNRCGVPLVEIVSEPDFRSAEEAGAYLTVLRELLRFIGVCDGNMERGSLRCDANVSVRPRGSHDLRERTEMKNLNSIRNVERAIEAEAERQIAIYESGGVVHRQTLQWDDQTDELRPMRVKEGSDDYRYFPEPDLVPLELETEFVEATRRAMPELPQSRRKRYREEFGLNDEAVYFLATERRLSDYYESLLDGKRNPVSVAGWIQGEVQRLLKEYGWEIEQFPVGATRFGALMDSVDKGSLNRNSARDVLRMMLSDDRDVDSIASELGFGVKQDDTQLAEIIDQVVTSSPDEFERYRQGKKNLIGYFMGQVMKAAGGNANPKLLQKLLAERLERE